MATPAPAAPAPGASYLIQNYGRSSVRFVRGNGCYLEDADGKTYLDAFAGVAVSALGYAHPKLVAAISRQAAAVTHVSNYYTIQEQETLAQLLVQAAFPGRVMFCNSGTEANEAALKIVRLWGNQVHEGRKTRLISFHGGFHGRTLGALALTANPKYREPFAPLAPVDFVPFGDVAAFTAAMGDDVAGVFLEPIQGEGGVVPAPEGFLATVRKLCDQHGALLVADEVQTGISRTGSYFAHQPSGIVPDVMSLAKGLGGGVPIGAIVAVERAASLLKPGLHGTTFGGNPLACAAGIVVAQEALNPAMLAHVTARGQELHAGLRRVFGAAALDIRGRGLLCGVQLPVDPSAGLIVAAREQGLIVGPSANNTLRLAPPLIITAEQIAELCTRLEAAWRRVPA
jgi:predicted acetylornithine/succinylornithine family transaminase